MKKKDAHGKSQSSVIYIAAVLTPILFVALLFGLDVGGLRSRILNPVMNVQENPPIDLFEDQKDALTIKEKQLNSKEQELSQWAAQLSLLEETLKLEQQETKRISDEALALKIEYFSHVRDLEEVVRLYEKMDPGNAAAILEILAQETSVRIMKRMKTEAAALILSEMTPLTASRLTAVLLDPMWKDKDAEIIIEKGGEQDAS